jgi:hypothetical protein
MVPVQRSSEAACLQDFRSCKKEVRILILTIIPAMLLQPGVIRENLNRLIFNQI